MLKDTEYAYAVSRIRANEISLLEKSDIDRLISTADNNELFRLLSDKGWTSAEETSNLSLILRNEAEKTWSLICDAVPDKNEYKFLIIENDFLNLKASLKALIAGTEPKDMFIYPSLTNPEKINKAVKEKSYIDLPLYLRDTANEAYLLITRTGDGQLTDIFIDCRALEAQYNAAKTTENKLFIKIAEAKVISSALKTGIRAAITGKEQSFIADALPDIDIIDKAALSRAASRGFDEFTGYIENVYGAAYAEAARLSVSAFEKMCDDRITDIIMSAKLISLGPEPVAAYFYAREAELKTVRIIASCKANGVDKENITKRVRELYV